MVKKDFIHEALMYHERFKPFNHRFIYKMFYLKFPVDHMGEMKSGLFSFNKWNLYSLYNKDYLDGSSRPLKEKITELLKDEELSFHHITLQTTPRILGYGFNPVSFWYFYNRNEELEAVLAEVNNTFGDRHYYLMKGHSEYKKIITNKVFHVSPFFGIEGQYEFSFFPKNVVINYFDPATNQYFFRSSWKETKSHEFSTGNLIKMFFKFPMMTFMVTARIHWQALKLYIKKATFYTRPEPPTIQLSKEVKQ